MRTNCCTSRRGRTGRRRSSKDQGHIEAKWREAAAVGSFVVGTAMDEEDEGRQGSGHGPSGCCGRPINWWCALLLPLPYSSCSRPKWKRGRHTPPRPSASTTRLMKSLKGIKIIFGFSSFITNSSCSMQLCCDVFSFDACSVNDQLFCTT